MSEIDLEKVVWFYKNEEHGIGFDRETNSIVVWRRK